MILQTASCYHIIFIYYHSLKHTGLQHKKFYCLMHFLFLAVSVSEVSHIQWK